MGKTNDSVPAGQDIDFAVSQTFKVVLVDAAGQVRDRIGYRFHDVGAQTAANGWNKQSADERRGLTAEIQPFDSVVPGLDSEASSQGGKSANSDSFDVVLVNNASGKVVLVGASGLSLSEAAERAKNANNLPDEDRLCTAVVMKAGQYKVESVANDDPNQEEDSEADSDQSEIDEFNGCYVVILNECGTYFVVDHLMDNDQALEFVRTWKQKTSWPVIVDAMEIGALDKLPRLSDRDEPGPADDANEVGNGSSYVNELGKGVQRLLVGHIEHVLSVIKCDGSIVHPADIGVVAKSFKRLAAQCTELDIPSKDYDPEKWEWESWNFDRAIEGQYKHERLELALESIMDEALSEVPA